MVGVDVLDYTGQPGFPAQAGAGHGLNCRDWLSCLTVWLTSNSPCMR